MDWFILLDLLPRVHLLEEGGEDSHLSLTAEEDPSTDANSGIAPGREEVPSTDWALRRVPEEAASRLEEG